MIHTELSLRLPNTPGALAGVSQLMSDERVNILAMALSLAASFASSWTTTYTPPACCASTITR